MTTTNYLDTFIAVADDCPVKAGEVPPKKGDQMTVANAQFDMLYDHPYQYTSDDVLFATHVTRNEIPKSEWKEVREQFFSKGQACLRSSPLAKRYGWGIHHDGKGKVALYSQESAKYKKFLSDKNLKQVKAMRSKRA